MLLVHLLPANPCYTIRMSLPAKCKSADMIYVIWMLGLTNALVWEEQTC